MFVTQIICNKAAITDSILGFLSCRKTAKATAGTNPAKMIFEQLLQLTGIAGL
jgi:hypothetical protein